MITEYQSGVFCRNIRCAQHAVLEMDSGEEYLRVKKEHCRDCNAWVFLNWLNDNQWRIVQKRPDASPTELAARIRGMDPASADELTVEDILSL
jgi:hypothetical protein